MANQIRVEGTMYPLEHDFGGGRAIINMEGAYVLVDAISSTDWELSGEPARENEKPVLASLVAGVKTETTFTKE